MTVRDTQRAPGDARFAAFAHGRRTFAPRVALASLGLHALGVLAWLAADAWTPLERLEAPRQVSAELRSAPQPRPAEASRSAREVSAPASESSAKRVRPRAVAPSPRRPTERPRAIREPVSPTAVAEPSAASIQPDLAVATGGDGEAGAVGAVHGDARGSGISPMLPPLPPPPPVRHRKQLLEQYLERHLRPALARQFRYPEEAQRRELQGSVTVRLTLRHDGGLAGVRVHGPCPHALLCNAALATVRRAAPFRPPPADLAAPVELDVQLVFALDGE